MANLKPKVTYFYRVGDGMSKWSNVYSYTTFGDDQESISYAVVADMAYDVNSDNTVSSISKLVDQNSVQVFECNNAYNTMQHKFYVLYEFICIQQCVIHSGDISYADGYEPHWDDFLNKVQPIAAKVPYMVSPGNHEVSFFVSLYFLVVIFAKITGDYL